MTPRHTTSGNRDPFATGYRYESKPYARFERPEGEVSLLTGTGVVLAGFALIAAFVTAFGG